MYFYKKILYIYIYLNIIIKYKYIYIDLPWHVGISE